MPDENDIAPSEEAGGSLADAIAAHLALKKEHGADPEVVESELEDALSPPRRDEPEAETEPEPQAAAPEPEPEPEPKPEPEPAPEPEPEPEAHAAPAPTVDDGSEVNPDPITEEEVASSVDEPKPGEITGTIEFEFGDSEEGEKPEEAAEEEPVSEHDLLEDTPDFFEETPEHDKLWFDEAPPRKFDF